MRNVLIIGPTYIYGGVGTLIFGLCKYMHSEKLHFDFLDYQNASDKEKNLIREMGGDFFHVPRYSKNPFKFLKYIFKFYKNNKYDFVHCNNSTAMLFMYTLPLWFSRKTKIICHSQSSFVPGKMDKIIHRFLRCVIIRRADIFIAGSEKAAVHMFGRKISSKGEYLLLKNGVDTSKFKYNEEIRSKIRIQHKLEDKYVIGHLGRFTQAKNHPFIVDVFSLVCNMDTNSVLLLVGGGEDEEEIRSKVNCLGLDDRVIFFGMPNDVCEVLQAMDVFFFPSLWEGLPVALVEAQAAGLPAVVSTAVASEAKITSGFHFMDLNNDSKEEWAKKLCSFKERYTRKDTCEDIINAGFDIKTSAKKLEKIYLGEANNAR